MVSKVRLTFQTNRICAYFSELDTFANETDVMWRGFVASAIAAVALQWVNPFGTAKLVLFQVRRFQIHSFVALILRRSQMPSIYGEPLNW